MEEIIYIRDRFFRTFTLQTISETIIRLIFCLSFPSKIYAFSLTGILLVFITFYILYIKKAIKNSYVIVLVLVFYYLTHYVYVMGTYTYSPLMMLWFLVVPIYTRIYFSNKILLIICAVVIISLFGLQYMTSSMLILDHYKEIVLDFYGYSTAQFIINFFIIIILCYNIFAFYYLIKILRIQHMRLDRYNTTSSSYNLKENSSIPEPMSHNNLDEINIVCNIPKTITNVRLSNIYQSITDYMESSECYLNPDYTLDQLAIDLRINRITLSSSLHRIGGVSFKDILNLYRINRAKKLFVDDTFKEYNIKQILFSVGFKYHTTFNRVFKKIEGITPSEYIINNRILK